MASDTTELVPVAGTVKGQELVVPQSGATGADLLFAIRNGLKLWVEEGTGTEEQFLERTLTSDATDEAAILGGVGLTKLEDLLNVPVRITRYDGMRNVDPQYLENSKLGVYVVCDLTDADGTIHTVALGSADAITKVVKLNDAGKIPTTGWCQFVKSTKPTASGFHPINLVAAEDPTGF